MTEFCSSIFGPEFNEIDTENYDGQSGLSALEINFGAPACFGFSAYFINGPVTKEELSYEDICGLIDQAKDLGLKKIVFSGKEAISCRYIKDAISYSGSLDIDAIILKDYYQVWTNSKNNIPPICTRHNFSCVVTSYGYVLPCPGLQIPVGNIHNQKLSDILKDSEILCDLKEGINRIKGPCRTCKEARNCRGCRGRAYDITGDYLASDPLCARNEKRRHEIFSLPAPAGRIIPQMPPMRVIDTIDKLGERSAQCSVLIKEEMPFTGKDGSVDRVAYLEMMAQAIAALNGFRNMDSSDSAPEGYLLGAKNLKINKTAFAGDRLSIMVFKYARYGGFGIVKGVVKRDGEILAEGEIKIWHKTDE
ncbi:MAG: SPASM domain-containing protein [Desulfobacteraceae bacterium]|nr:MAG: SPASM domain-containing protein [Desulfobacteraceae bacterium]